MSSANQIVAVIPYFFYSKGDQKDSFKRVPITAKLVTNLLKKAGASHVMIMDPHTPQLEGFFDAPVDALKVYVQKISIVCSVYSKIWYSLKLSFPFLFQFSIEMSKRTIKIGIFKS